MKIQLHNVHYMVHVTMKENRYLIMILILHYQNQNISHKIVKLTMHERDEKVELQEDPKK